jgi:nucleotide-binding universal stress UspA family protein
MFVHARCNDRWTERREKIVRASVQVWPQPAAPGNRAPVVVCGIDGARADKEVVVFAAELTRRTGGRLILLRVQRPPLIGLEPQVAYAAPQTGPDATRDQIAAARALARLAVDAGVAESTDVRVGSGDLEQQLLTTARDEQATVLVVGSRGRGAVKAALLGSVSTDLIGVARCPVLVVPPQAEPPGAVRVQTTAASMPPPT